MIIKQKSSVHLVIVVIVSIAGYVLGITVLACFFSTICQTLKDTNGLIRSRNAKDRQDNGQKKKTDKTMAKR